VFRTTDNEDAARSSRSPLLSLPLRPVAVADITLGDDTRVREWIARGELGAALILDPVPGLLSL
jgi:hypothetical protein